MFLKTWVLSPKPQKETSIPSTLWKRLYQALSPKPQNEAPSPKTKLQSQHFVQAVLLSPKRSPKPQPLLETALLPVSPKPQKKIQSQHFVEAVLWSPKPQNEAPSPNRCWKLVCWAPSPKTKPQAPNVKSNIPKPQTTWWTALCQAPSPKPQWYRSRLVDDPKLYKGRGPFDLFGQKLF